MAAWNVWVRRRTASFTDIGNTFGPGRQITKEGTIELSLSSNRASGYSIVNTEHIDAAEQLLEGCPIVDSVTLYEALAIEDPARETTDAHISSAAGAIREEVRQRVGAQACGPKQQEGSPMRSINAERTLAAQRSSVWAVLADYPNIGDWNEGIKSSYAIGDATEGVGAQRQCEIVPNGKMRMRETVSEWVPEEKMVLVVDNIEKQPIKAATMTLALSGGGDTTPCTMTYDYEPKGGALAFVFGPMLDRQMKKAFQGFMENLETAAQAAN
ncbi:MAG: SRPBCC family protein [Actinomycetia bacterium]|nr:SRPBCC family protein [Actinomycetes bacterium]